MPSVNPEVVLRLGSHAEKEYFEKTIQFFDGIVVGANLLEASPGATSSLLLRYWGKHKVPYMIDPMTYAFGVSVDAETRKPKTDLDWLKSEQTKKGSPARRDFKRSYKALAKQYGGLIGNALSTSKSISDSDLTNTVIEATCKAVIEYQQKRVTEELTKDEELKKLTGTVPSPSRIFTPYFFITRDDANRGVDTALSIARIGASVAKGLPLYSVICADHVLLLDKTFMIKLQDELPKTGVKGVWFWFSEFREEQVDEAKLAALRTFVLELSKRGLQIGNFHGGYFSLALSKCGMNTISHGIGYGEQKDVVPVIGQTTPTVRYYLPSICRRLGVPDIERCFKSLGVITPSDFYSHICKCVVCRGVIKDKLDNFSEFGVRHFSTDDAKRMSQTPAAAKRCRFHFLLNRAAERDDIQKKTMAQIADDFKSSYARWGTMPSVVNECGHLPRWQKVLTSEI